ncbi:hypothetical protein D9R92_20835, partial [Escherichia coli]|nr:hypothetical protein [Escherichia coli]
ICFLCDMRVIIILLKIIRKSKMTETELKNIIKEVKQLNDTKYSHYENLVYVLKSLDDNEKRMSDVVKTPTTL